MLEHLKEEANKTLTENLAVTHAGTGSECVDLFATIGALRGAKTAEIERRFMRAFAEDRDVAMKLAFYARDVRGGLGERRAFRIILRWLAKREPASARKNIPHVPEYGRFDDLLSLLGTPCEDDLIVYLKERLDEDLRALDDPDGAPSLLGKWLPSVNASSRQTVAAAKRIARALGMDDARYRRTLSKLRARIGIIEDRLRQRDYSFDYSKQPSKAMYKYRRAFLRNDEERYQAFLGRVASGEATMHTGTLTPYDVIAPFLSERREPPTEAERRVADVTWNALEDFTNGEDALVVIDGSGSMYSSYTRPMPASVALSLGIYFAERDKGAFRGHFITFSERPQLVEIKGADIYEKVRYCMSFNEVANTDLERVFALILDTAVKHHVPQAEMPSTLYIVSDMEFDFCARNASLTNFENAKQMFEERGYALPKVVFWNVDSRNQQQPVRKNEQGVCLVSGCTPRLFSMVMSGDTTPWSYMMDVLGGERYAKITA